MPNPSPFPESALPARLRFHLQRLRLRQSESAYLDWCRTHGFHPTTRKSEHALAAELSAWQRRTGAQALARSRRMRDPNQTLLGVCEGTLASSDVSHTLRAPCKRIEALQNKKHRAVLAQMIRATHRARFLPETCRFGDQTLPYLEGLIHLAARRHAWIRAPEDWQVRSKNRRKQFSAFLRHLLVRYPVPAFLDAAWMRSDERADEMRTWFLHIGSGANLRTLKTPVPVTKRIVHHFMLAPDGVSIEQALRWGQVHALGGRADLARAVMDCSLGSDLSEDAFWQSALRFFVAEPTLQTHQVGPLVDYIRQQRFEPTEVVRPDGTLVVSPPPKPNFSMRGRKLSRLLAEMNRWHTQLGKMSGGADAWRPSDTRGYEEAHGTVAKNNLKTWRIAELNTRKLLADEGRAMRHCVLSYAELCRRGHSSIWSLTRETKDGLRRLQTIQVTTAGTIVQSRGRANDLPTEQIKSVIRRWASREGLTISCFV